MTGMTTEEFLAHHGVKGMRWGVRKTTDSVGSAAKGAGKATQLGSDEFRRKAVATGKVAFTVVKIGAPTVLVASGVGVPIAASLGISMKLVSEPQIRDALKDAGQYTKSLMPDIGNTSLSDMRKSVGSKLPHIDRGPSKKEAGDAVRKDREYLDKKWPDRHANSGQNGLLVPKTEIKPNG